MTLVEVLIELNVWNTTIIATQPSTPLEVAQLRLVIPIIHSHILTKFIQSVFEIVEGIEVVCNIHHFCIVCRMNIFDKSKSIFFRHHRILTPACLCAYTDRGLLHRQGIFWSQQKKFDFVFPESFIESR